MRGGADASQGWSELSPGVGSGSRDRSVETLRGLAAVLVVLAHVIGLPDTGLEVGDRSLLRWWFAFTIPYRMPLFTVIAGYVYAWRPVQAGRTREFLAGKARRLVYPLVFVSTLQYLVSAAVPGTHYAHPLSRLWRVYFFSFDQFWFVQAIVLVFVSMPLLERSGALRTAPRLLLTLAAAIVVQSFMPHRNLLFSFEEYFYLLAGFVFGVGLNRFQDVFLGPRMRVCAGALFALAVGVQQLVFYHRLDLVLERDRGPGMLVGLAGSLFLFSVRGGGNAWLAWLGGYAFEIYLFHRFGQAGARIVLRALGVQAVGVLFAAGMVAGLGVPLLMRELFRRTRLTRRLFLGEA